MLKTLIFSITFLLCLQAPPTRAEQAGRQGPPAALEKARRAMEARDFEEAFEILKPYLGGDLSTSVDWEITAEAGRAAFSLGKLKEARSLLKKAVAARPTVAETAVYLEATSYLLGDRRQALMIFEALLQSHVPDLYLAVTLPGEVRFLADPDVRALLKRYAIPLEIQPDTENLLSLHLGQARAEVIATLRTPPTEDRVLMARAGPELIWFLSFDKLGMLQEAVFHADHLQRYTPYSLKLGLSTTPGAEILGWETHPQGAIRLFGPPETQTREVDGALKLHWLYPGSGLELIFEGVPGADLSKGHLQMLRLAREKGPG